MKSLKFILLSAVLIVAGQCAFAQEPAGQVYIIRSLNYVGSAVPFNIYIDDSLACKLQNKKYSVHDLKPGKHSFSVQATGLSSHQKSMALEIEVSADKSNYLYVADNGALSLLELMPASGEQLVKTTARVTNCLPKK